MSSTEILVPDGIAEDDSEIVVANWVVADGEHVDKGDLICELMVTKVTVEVPAPATGTLEQRASEEDIVAAGAVLGVIAAG